MSVDIQIVEFSITLGEEKSNGDQKCRAFLKNRDNCVWYPKGSDDTGMVARAT